MTGVPLATASWHDPRFSRAQVEALTMAASADPKARLLGLDYAMRPVVRARLGIPRQERTYAIQRNGDPTEPKRDERGEEMTPGRANFLLEPWTEVRS